MRSIRSVALSCVLVVAGLLGTPAAASAAPAAFGIGCGVWGTVHGSSGTIQLCPTVSEWDPAQSLQVQVLQNGAWVTRRTYRPGQLRSWDCAFPEVAALVGEPGTFRLRALTSATATRQKAEAQTTVTLAKTSGSVDV